MIEVEVHYYNRQIKNKHDDFFIYTYFKVKGHANNGNRDDCIKVCAGVSACVNGLQRLLNSQQYQIKFESGLFEIKIKTGHVCDNTYVDKDTCYGLNTLLCQLYDLYQMYHSQFSKFEMIEVKEKELEEYGKQRISSNTKNKPRPRPFRELKKRRMGSTHNS